MTCETCSYRFECIYADDYYYLEESVGEEDAESSNNSALLQGTNTGQVDRSSVVMAGGAVAGSKYY